LDLDYLSYIEFFSVGLVGKFCLATVMTLFVMELLTGVGHFFFFTDDCL